MDVVDDQKRLEAVSSEEAGNGKNKTTLFVILGLHFMDSDQK